MGKGAWRTPGEPLTIFFSYSHRDETMGLLSSLIRRAIDLSNADESNPRLSLFVDGSNILPGSQWRKAIDDALESTNIFLPCITSNYCLSSECAHEFNQFERVLDTDSRGRACVPLFWQDIPNEVADARGFHAEILSAARAKNGIELSGVTTLRTESRDLVEQLIVTELSRALCRAAKHARESLARPAERPSQQTSTTPATSDQTAGKIEKAAQAQEGENASYLVQLAASFRKKRRWAEAEILYQEAIDQVEAGLGSRRQLGELYWWLANVKWNLGDTAGRKSALHKAIEVYRETEDNKNLSTCLGMLADVYREQERSAEAAKTYREAIHFGRESGQSAERLGRYCWWLANIYMQQGDAPAAVPFYRSAIDHYRKLGDRKSLASCLFALSLALDDPVCSESMSALRESLAVRKILLSDGVVGKDAVDSVSQRLAALSMIESQRRATEAPRSNDPPGRDPYAGIGRNDPCPCGSGKKFKICHGRDRFRR